MASTRIRARILVALLSLTLLAGSAAAECAWVLWEEDKTIALGQKSSVDKWQVLFARKTQESCEGLLTRVLEGFVTDHREKGQRIESGDRFYTGTTAAGDRRIIKYHCLPDSIDPRGPKGGGR
jgi:hypothetical protein